MEKDPSSLLLLLTRQVLCINGHLILTFDMLTSPSGVIYLLYPTFLVSLRTVDPSVLELSICEVLL